MTVTEEVRFVQEGKDGVCTYWDETLTKEYELPEEPAVPEHRTRTSQVSTFSINNSNEGYYTFTTFEDLKTLAAGTNSDYVFADYTGEDALVITEDLVIPKYLEIYANEIVVPEGIMFITYGWIGSNKLTVNGTVQNFAGMRVSEALTVNGILQSDTNIFVEADTAVTGEDNITFNHSWASFYYDVVVYTAAELETYAALAAASNSRYSIRIGEAMLLDRSVSIPENCDVHLGNDCSLTVQAGCTLSVAGYTGIFGTLVVEGTLLNEEQISVYYDEGGTISFAAGSTYDGKGGIIINSEYLMDPAVAVPGLNMANFDVKKFGDEYSSYWELNYIVGMTKLATPTDPEWGYDHDHWEWDEELQEWKQNAVAAPGFMSWKPVEPTQAEAYITVYKEGQEGTFANYGWGFGSTEVPEWRSVDSFCLDGPESGTYYFTVCSRGDYVNYYNSDIAISDTWTYVKPDSKVGSCSNLTWDWPTIRYTAPADMTNVGGYEVEFYYSPTQDGVPEPRSSSWTRYADDIFTLEVDDWMIREFGLGYYYYKVRALSADITVACNGEWSELSPAFNLTDLAAGVESKLENVIADSASMTDDEIRNAVQSLDTADLKSAMLADQNVVDNVAVLEEQVGGAAAVEVTNDANAFDPEKISVVGANLNNAESAEDPIKLIIDKPEKDHVIDTAYDNSVAVKFGMDLDNVEDTENLAVPVKITLPVPANINPAFLVILHYHADGSVEELSMSNLHIYQECGEYYASFVLTSFSDFVMTQFTTVPMHRLYNPNSGEHFYTGSIEERDMLISYGWQYEGIAWNAPISFGAPVYRMFNPNNGDHHYTMSWEEVEMLKGYGWQYEGVAWNSADADNAEALPLYRLYNPNADCGSHHYTGSEEERDMLLTSIVERTSMNDAGKLTCIFMGTRCLEQGISEHNYY